MTGRSGKTFSRKEAQKAQKEMRRVGPIFLRLLCLFAAKSLAPSFSFRLHHS
jgi:hypothetical protein